MSNKLWTPLPIIDTEGDPDGLRYWIAGARRRLAVTSRHLEIPADLAERAATAFRAEGWEVEIETIGSTHGHNYTYLNFRKLTKPAEPT